MHSADATQAWDVCAANRILNHLLHDSGMEFDDGGRLAAIGLVDMAVVEQLNQLPYYQQTPPKSLSNQWAFTEVLPIINAAGLAKEDALATYVEHIAQQVAAALQSFRANHTERASLLCTGGGAWNDHLVDRLGNHLQHLGIDVTVPEPELVNFKEALVMALLGVLRWREDETVLPGATGASRSSIGGALWMGQS